MKNTTLILLSLIMIVNISKAQQENRSVVVNITNIKTNKGQIKVSIYRGDNNFLKKPLFTTNICIKNNAAHMSFDNLKAGVYAISCIHDKNMNNKLDFNIMGIPCEPTGASNNAKGFLGPPSYNDSKFTISEENIIQNIKL